MIDWTEFDHGVLTFTGDLGEELFGDKSKFSGSIVWEMAPAFGEVFPMDEPPDDELLIDSLGEFVMEPFLSKHIPSEEPLLLLLPLLDAL